MQRHGIAIVVVMTIALASCKGDGKEVLITGPLTDGSVMTEVIKEVTPSTGRYNKASNLQELVSSSFKTNDSEIFGSFPRQVGRVPIRENSIVWSSSTSNHLITTRFERDSSKESSMNYISKRLSKPAFLRYYRDNNERNHIEMIYTMDPIYRTTSERLGCISNHIKEVCLDMPMSFCTPRQNESSKSLISIDITDDGLPLLKKSRLYVNVIDPLGLKEMPGSLRMCITSFGH